MTSSQLHITCTYNNGPTFGDAIYILKNLPTYMLWNGHSIAICCNTHYTINLISGCTFCNWSVIWWRKLCISSGVCIRDNCWQEWEDIIWTDWRCFCCQCFSCQANVVCLVHVIEFPWSCDWTGSDRNLILAIQTTVLYYICPMSG